VAAWKDRWRVEDEWWRRPIRRTYYAVELEGGRLLTLFYDHENDCWRQQWDGPAVEGGGGGRLGGGGA